MTSGVYPEPKLYLYEAKREDHRHRYEVLVDVSLDFRKTANFRSTLEAIEWNTMRHSDGKFSVFSVATADVENLIAGSMFYCDLRIPGTGYVRRKQMLYYPLGKMQLVKIERCRNRNCNYL